jgi:hypothetical protein
MLARLAFRYRVSSVHLAKSTHLPISFSHLHIISIVSFLLIILKVECAVPTMGSHHPRDDWSQADPSRSFAYPTPSTATEVGTHDYYTLGTQWRAPDTTNTTDARQENGKAERNAVDPFLKEKGYRRNPLGDWASEAFSMTLAIGLIIAIALILKLFEDREQPKWPHELSLNSVIAILSTILRAILAFVIAEGMFRNENRETAHECCGLATVIDRFF